MTSLAGSGSWWSDAVEVGSAWPSRKNTAPPGQAPGREVGEERVKTILGYVADPETEYDGIICIL